MQNFCYNTSCSAGVAHPVERHLAKVEVASSSLVARSIKTVTERWLFFFYLCKDGDGMIRFAFLDKQEKDRWLPILFDLMYENVHPIAPSGLSYDAEKRMWLAEISPALDRKPREIIMVFCEDRLIGYLQYYTRSDLLVVEELQLHADFHRTLLFGQMCRFLLQHLPENISRVEAYADKRNVISMKLMEKLGMRRIDDPADAFAHLRGDFISMKYWFNRIK